MLQWLETFRTVVSAGSISQAADRLRLTQPAVTKQIRALESELGVQLLVRGPRGVTLTPVGEAIHRHAVRAAGEADACRRLSAEWRDPSSGRLVVGAGLATVLYTLPPVIERFRLDRPGVQIVVMAGNSEETLTRLLDHQVDIALVTAPVIHPEVHCTTLFHDRLVLVAARRHPFAWGGQVAIGDLLGQPLIAPVVGSGLRRHVEQVLLAHGTGAPVVMEFGSLEAIKAMVALDLGISILPLSAVQEDVKGGRLAAVRVADWPPPGGKTVALLERAGAYAPGPARFFASLARQMLVDETEPA